MAGPAASPSARPNPEHETPANEPTLPASALQAHAMLESLPEAMLLLNAEGRIEAANAACETLFMQSRKRLLGQSVLPMVMQAEGLQRWLRQCWRRQEPQKERGITLLPRHQKPLPVRLELWPVMDARGDEACALLARLRASTPNLAPSAPSQEGAAYMAAVLAHEIKNPLSGIRGAAQLILPHLPDAAMGELILREVDRIRALVEQMEILGEPKQQALEKINIHAILRHACLLVQTGAANLLLEERYDPSLPEISGRHDALTQIILNLMKNGLEAMEECDVPHLTLQTDYYRRGASGQSYVRLRITDHGAGIPDALQPSIFEPFVTSKESGKGLGLAICAKLAHEMNAQLQLAHSEPGNTCFELLLSLHAENGLS